MRLMVIIFLTCATGGFSSDLTELMGDATRMLVFGVDDIGPKLLHGMGRSLTDFLETNPLDSNTTNNLELATDSIADGIDVIVNEMKLFETFPIVKGVYETQIRIAMRLVLSEMVKGVIQLRRMLPRRGSRINGE